MKKLVVHFWQEVDEYFVYKNFFPELNRELVKLQHFRSHHCKWLTLNSEILKCWCCHLPVNLPSKFKR